MPRILTTHVGSLVRPTDLLDLAEARDGSDAAEQAYAAALARRVDEVVARQVQTGLDIVNDGEFGKSSWIGYLYDRVGGTTSRAEQVAAHIQRRVVSRDRQRFPEVYDDENRRTASAGRAGMLQLVAVTGPLRYTGHAALGRDIDDLRAALDRCGGGREGFLPVVAPASAEFFMLDEHYDDEETFIFALAEVLRHEYRAIVDAGLILQIDDAVLAHEMDSMLARGQPVAEYRRWAQLRVDALNHALEGIPEERVRYHVCWGSFHVPHTSDPELREIVDLILQVNAGGYLIEQANARHEHEWEVWRDVELPDGRKLIPGFVTHSTPLVEHPELVAQRIVRVAQLVGPENVIAGTDCGFAQGAGMRRVHESVQWAKLESLVRGAQLASQRLATTRGEMANG